MSTVKAKIHLRFSSSFATMLNVNPTSLIGMDVDIDNGATIDSVFHELVSRYPLLGKYLFDPDSGGKVNERLDVVINNNLIKGKNIADIGLKDGDRLILLPVYEGG